MTEKQEKLLCLYKEIDDICKRNNIEYYMAGGTLIGAVRHRGYIPWDDDMDVYMTRDNWLKFLQVCKTELPKNRVIECQELDRGYYNMFGRYVDTETTAIHAAQILFDDTAGFVVDILVLDPISDDPEFYERYLCDLMLYSDLINGSVVYSYRWKNNKHRYKYYRMLAHVLGKEKVLSELERRMFTYPEDKCTQYAMRWGGAPFIFPKEMFNGMKWADFEGIKCPIPTQTCAYLTWHYGDEWMFIPKHDEQESHEAVYSLELDYKPVMEEIKQVIDRRELNKVYRKRKSRVFSAMDSFHANLDSSINVRAVAFSKEMSTCFAARREEIKALFAEKKYFELSEIFSDYFFTQCSADFIGREDFVNIYRFNHPAFIEIGDEFFTVAMRILVNTERISKAMRLIDIYEQKKGKLTAELVEIRADVLRFRSAVNAYEEGKVDYTFSVISELLEKHPSCIALLKFKTILLLKQENPEKNRSEIEQLLERGLSMCPQSGDFLKYQADLRSLTDKKGALEDYVNAFSLTKNGLTQLDIADIISENIEDFLEIVRSKKSEDAFEAYSLLRKAIAILPENTALMCERLNCVVSEYEADKSLFFSVKNLVRAIVVKNPEMPEILKIYRDFLMSFVQNEAVVELLFEKDFLADVEEKRAFGERLFGRMTECSEDSELFGWYELVYGDTLVALGKRKEAYSYYLKALEHCGSEGLSEFLRDRFMSDLKYTVKEIKFAQKRKIPVEDEAGSDKMPLIKLYSAEWGEKFPTAQAALDFYCRIGAIDSDAVEYINRFKLFGADENKPWSASEIRLFGKICFRFSDYVLSAEDSDVGSRKAVRRLLYNKFLSYAEVSDDEDAEDSDNQDGRLSDGTEKRDRDIERIIDEEGIAGDEEENVGEDEKILDDDEDIFDDDEDALGDEDEPITDEKESTGDLRRSND